MKFAFSKKKALLAINANVTKFKTGVMTKTRFLKDLTEKEIRKRTGAESPEVPKAVKREKHASDGAGGAGSNRRRTKALLEDEGEETIARIKVRRAS